MFLDIIKFLDTKMETPTMYGWFHLTFFALSIIMGILFSVIYKRPDMKTVKQILLTISVITVILEIYKQFNFTFRCENNKLVIDYQWYAFPFQFCSTPMYVGLLAGLTKHKKFHNTLCSYLATFALFAGLCVMFYPNTVFVPTIGINVQTMICHGSMITIGIFLLSAGYVGTENKTILKGMLVFVCCVIIAIAMNGIAYYSDLKETFNMFFISPHQAPSLPVYSIVQQYVPFPWCLLIYIAGFSLASYIVLLLAKALREMFKKR